MADIAIRIEHIEGVVTEHKGALDEHDDRLDTHSSELQRLRLWRDGNGAKGAETRLQVVETDLATVKACVQEAIAPEHITHIAREAAKAVVTNAKDRDKTTVAKIRAVGPLFTGIAALLTGVAALVALLVR